MLASPPAEVVRTPPVLHILRAAQAMNTPAERPNGDGSEDMQQG